MKLKKFIFPIIICALLTAFDQFIKHIIASNYALYESKPVIKNVFEISYIRNTGSAWGMLSGKIPFLLTITVIVILALFYVYNNISENKIYRPLRILIVFLLAGALGNMIDRIEYGYVIDFFYFKLINFPVFNIADIYVTVSIAIILILVIFKYNSNDFDVILGEKILLEDGTYKLKKEAKSTKNE